MLKKWRIARPIHDMVPMSVIALGAILFASGCDDDSPAEPDDDGHGDEVEIEGFELRSGATVLVSQDEGVLMGDLDVEPGESMGPLQVVFLGHEGKVVDPEDGATLEFTVGDDAIAAVTPDGTDAYAFTLDGVADGETTLSFDLLHKGHTDFESMDIPVHVEHEEVEIEGFELRSGGTVLVSQDEGVLTGELDVETGESLGPLEVVFLGHEGKVVEPEEGAMLEFTVGDMAFATVAPDGTDAFAFTLNGVADGATTLSFDLLHKGHTDFESLDIPVSVEAPPGP